MHTAGTDPLYPVHSLSLNAEYTLHFHAEAPGPVLYSPAKGLHHPPSLCGIFSYILIPFIARPTHTVKHIPPVSGVKCDSNEKEPFCQACRHPFLLRCLLHCFSPVFPAVFSSAPAPYYAVPLLLPAVSAGLLSVYSSPHPG